MVTTLALRGYGPRPEVCIEPGDPDSPPRLTISQGPLAITLTTQGVVSDPHLALAAALADAAGDFLQGCSRLCVHRRRIAPTPTGPLGRMVTTLAIRGHGPAPTATTEPAGPYQPPRLTIRQGPLAVTLTVDGDVTDPLVYAAGDLAQAAADFRDACARLRVPLPPAAPAPTRPRP